MGVQYIEAIIPAGFIETPGEPTKCNWKSHTIKNEFV